MARALARWCRARPGIPRRPRGEARQFQCGAVLHRRRGSDHAGLDEQDVSTRSPGSDRTVPAAARRLQVGAQDFDVLRRKGREEEVRERAGRHVFFSKVVHFHTERRCRLLKRPRMRDEFMLERDGRSVHQRTKENRRSGCPRNSGIWAIYCPAVRNRTDAVAYRPDFRPGGRVDGADVFHPSCGSSGGHHRRRCLHPARGRALSRRYLRRGLRTLCQAFDIARAGNPLPSEDMRAIGARIRILGAMGPMGPLAIVTSNMLWPTAETFVSYASATDRSGCSMVNAKRAPGCDRNSISHGALILQPADERRASITHHETNEVANPWLTPRRSLPAP